MEFALATRVHTHTQKFIELGRRQQSHSTCSVPKIARSGVVLATGFLLMAGPSRNRTCLGGKLKINFPLLVPHRVHSIILSQYGSKSKQQQGFEDNYFEQYQDPREL